MIFSHSFSSYSKKGSSQGFLWLVCLLGILLFAGKHSRAGAETQSGDDGEVIQVRASIPAGGDRSDIPSFSTSIEIDERENRFRTLAEILARTEGVGIRNFGGLGKLSTVSIRGSSSQQVVVYLDGFRLNTAQNGSIDFSNLPLAGLKRVEVLRGGDSARFGSGAIGGVVNLVTKSDFSKDRSSLALMLGSFDTLQFQWNRLGRIPHWFDYLAAVEVFHTDGDFQYTPERVKVAGSSLGGGKERTRENNQSQYASFLFKVRKKLGQGITLSLLEEFFVANKEIPGSEFFPLPRAEQRDLRNLTGLELHIPGLAPELDLKAKVFQRWDYLLFRDPSPALGGKIDLRHSNFTYGGELLGRYYLSAWGEHEISLTASLREERLSSDQLSPPHRLSLELRGQDEIFWGEETFVLSPGFSYLRATDFGDQWSGKLGGQWNLPFWGKGKMALKGNFRQVFRFPEFNELYYPNQGFVRGNRDLRPEEGWSADGGWEISYPWGKWEMALFWRELENSIVWVNISPTTIAPVNTDRVRARGVETSVSFYPLKWLKTKVNYTYLEAELLRSNTQLPGRPKHRVGGNFEVRQGRFFYFGRLFYSSQIPVNLAGTILLKDYIQLDGGLGFYPWPQAQLSLEVKNILDEPIRNVRGFPLPGRSVFAKIVFTF